MKYKKLITQKQKELLDYIEDYARINQKPPTRKEMAERFGVHRSTIEERLAALEAKGRLKIIKNTWRGLTINGCLC